MTSCSRGSGNRLQITAFLIILCTALMVSCASGYGYSTDYEGYLGEVIALNGLSYNSDEIYLFMTGPGLPENGVTLTDTSARADQGQFTTIDVDSNQQWSYKWDTMKLQNQIDPGTYTVYAVNAPVDKANLDGHSYQALTVYLKDGMLAKDRVSVGAKYTLNLADDDPVTTVTTVVTAVPTTVPTTVPTPATTETTAVPTPVPTTKSSPLPVLVVVSLVAGALCLRWQNRR